MTSAGSRLIASSALLLGAGCSPEPPRPTAAPSSERTESLLETRQEEAYRALGWKLVTHSQADLDAWVHHVHAKQVVFSLLQRDTPPERAAWIVEQIDKRLDRMRAKGLLRLLTKYEDLRTHLELAIIVDQIEEGMETVFRSQLVPRPVFGTLPTGEINGHTEAMEWGDEYLVTFESGFFAFADALSGVVAETLPDGVRDGAWTSWSLKRDDVERHLDSHSAIVSRLGALVGAYVLEGAPRLAAVPERQHLDERRETFARSLYRSMLLFAMGHEYGHVLTLHQRLTPNPRLPAAWGQEIAADGWGVMLSMLSFGGEHRDLATTLWGMKFFLTCRSVHERSLRLLTTGSDAVSESEDGYPSDERRLAHFANHVRVVAKQIHGGNLPATAEELESMLHDAERFDVLLSVLWSRLRPVIVLLHEAGMKPAAVWRSSR